MKRIKKHEKGQALILIAISMVGIISLTALAMDSGNAFADRRQAQNAADTAAMAAAYAKANDDPAWVAAGEARATSNGYTDGPTTTVDVFSPPTDSFYAGDDDYLQVTIVSTVDTWFASIVGVETVTNRVFAIARAEPSVTGQAFFGNAIVGLATTGTCFEAGGTPDWNIVGGGIMVNSSSNPSADEFGTGDVFAPSITTPGYADSFSNIPGGSQNNDMEQMPYPPDNMLFPREPACNGDAIESPTDTFSVEPNKDGSKIDLPSEADHENIWLNPGVYCATGDNLDLHGTISGDNVMIFFIDPDYDIKVNGSDSGFAISAPTTGEYAGLALYFPLADPPYTSHQEIDLRGNANGTLVGTIMAPSAEITMFGNPNSAAYEAQIIGYCIDTGGTADIQVQYNDDQNYDVTVPPSLELVQ
jgi:hypothetical protein